MVLSTSAIAALPPAPGKALDQEQLFLPISETLPSEPDFVTARCHGFLHAVRIYRQIMRSNPLHGRDRTHGTEFDWIDDPDFYRPLTKAAQRLDDMERYAQAYLSAFGSIEVPSLVSHTPLYQSDKETCLTRFGSDPS
ncbi:hypothetical protein FIU86_07325 [Roseovarius sp. THAF9]|nr:hypothetical protein FIU86_07325 [Roseovarius sp. THAF9]